MSMTTDRHSQLGAAASDATLAGSGTTDMDDKAKGKAKAKLISDFVDEYYLGDPVEAFWVVECLVDKATYSKFQELVKQLEELT
jgi:hypothetical protein